MIEWQDKTRFRVGDVNFRGFDWVFGSRESTTDEYFLQKDAAMIDVYEGLFASLQPRRIVELGIWQGGSCVFFHALARPEKLVAIELSTQRIAALDSYITDGCRQQSLVPHYGVNQADTAALANILAKEFGEEQLDLVIDDASHFVEETRTSFNLLFPRLRPGGVYVIEDWAWGHDPVDQPDSAVNLYPDREPLSRLVFEIVLATASTRGLIAGVDIDRNLVRIIRGSAPLEREGFDVARCCLPRGRSMLADPAANHPA
ncbi:hypothetical protein E2F43_17900 [Seongchinamella unica]|uniref:Rhamnosyl O-methyltransferase n=1 Tax=Seongchinamella unica TaxID=2547392 RepID=A0A4R5LN27_9GAMM|nr:class I SAM-dependent methyltransferase [Seongchinamella unica]TDG11588.1 hypothetical protein E2F43_17900 [Seongchinamella unica]